MYNASYNICAKFADEKSNIDSKVIFKEINGRYLPLGAVTEEEFVRAKKYWGDKTLCPQYKEEE